jgi:hypothetical protein
MSQITGLSDSALQLGAEHHSSTAAWACLTLIVTQKYGCRRKHSIYTRSRPIPMAESKAKGCCVVCDQPATQRCPSCPTHSPPAYFCGKACFASVWKQHKREHNLQWTSAAYNPVWGQVEGFYPSKATLGMRVCGVWCVCSVVCVLVLACVIACPKACQVRSHI